MGFGGRGAFSAAGCVWAGAANGGGSSRVWAIRARRVGKH